MYLKYWGLKEQPFNNVPDRSVFFHSNQHEEALIRLLYAVENRKGFAMLTGEVGSGKTTVSRVLAKRLPKEKYSVKIIINPALNPLDLIRAILLEFDERASSDSKTILLSQLQNRLIQNLDKGLNTVLILDEAHLISDRASLEELRMLLNMQSEDQFLLTLIIIGQPPLLDTIADLNSLKERIYIKYHIEPLNIQNTLKYILYRLKVAGAQRALFSEQSVKLLYEYSKGIPLRINNVSDRCLLMGMMNKVKHIDSKIVKFAIEDLKQ